MRYFGKANIAAESVKRFNKGGLPIPFIKINLRDDATQKDLITNGFFMNNIFNMPKLFFDLKKTIICFKSSCFDHVGKNCRNSEKRRLLI